VWTGTAFEPERRFHNILNAAYGAGELVDLIEHHDRSTATHNHEFAWLKEAWETLPDHLKENYPSAEHLRKRALIATGWCTVRDHVCTTRAEAQRLAVALRGELDAYAVVIINDAVVRVCRAVSQSRGKMHKAAFQQSKTDIINYVADLLSVEPGKLAGIAA
jgi:hypothetical protein